MKNLTVSHVFLIMMGVQCVINIAHAETMKPKDHVDPFDLLNFDPSLVKMRKNDRESKGSSDDSSKIPIVSGLKNEDHPEKKPTAIPAFPSHKDTPECICPDKGVAACEPLSSLFKQYLRQLVRILEPQVPRIDVLQDVYLRLHVSGHDLEVLRQYTESTKTNIHAAHETLSHMLREAGQMERMGKTFYWLEEHLGLSKEALVHISIISVCAVMILKAVPKLSIKLIASLIYGVSVVFTWFEIYQKELADQEKRFMKSDNSHCLDLQSLPWYSRLGNYLTSSFTFQEEDCREYYQAMVVNPVFKVSPLEACAMALVKTIVRPMEIVGHGIKRFLIGLLKDLPLHLQANLVVFLAIAIILLLFLCSGYRIQLPLIAFEPTHRVAIQPPRQMQQVMSAPSEQRSISQDDGANNFMQQIKRLPAQMAQLNITDSGQSQQNESNEMTVSERVSNSRQTLSVVAANKPSQVKEIHTNVVAANKPSQVKEIHTNVVHQTDSQVKNVSISDSSSDLKEKDLAEEENVVDSPGRQQSSDLNGFKHHDSSSKDINNEVEENRTLDAEWDIIASPEREKAKVNEGTYDEVSSTVVGADVLAGGDSSIIAKGK